MKAKATKIGTEKKLLNLVMAQTVKMTPRKIISFELMPFKNKLIIASRKNKTPIMRLILPKYNPWELLYVFNTDKLASTDTTA